MTMITEHVQSKFFQAIKADPDPMPEELHQAHVAPPPHTHTQERHSTILAKVT